MQQAASNPGLQNIGISKYRLINQAQARLMKRTSLHITLLGNALVYVNGVPIERFRTNRVFGLLVFLAESHVSGRQLHRRKFIATLLWPGLPQKYALQNLRNTLYELKKLIPDDGDTPFLVSNRQTIQINPDFPFQLDTDLLLKAAAGQNQEEVAELYTGEFLADFTLDDAAPFTEWVLERRDFYKNTALPLLGSTHASAANNALSPTVFKLPKDATPFVGRHNEITTIHSFLNNPTTQCMTILGAGGMGKTRLSLAVAKHNQDQLKKQFPDGVIFVPLSQITQKSQLVPVLAAAVDAILENEADIEDQLHYFLSRKQMLLILDNCEHLIEDLLLLSKIMDAAPQVKILATSREKLNLVQEQLFVLQGLEAPSSHLSETYNSFAAVELFVQSAKRVQMDFDLDPKDYEDLLSICRTVESMPLALELAAGWVEYLSISDIAKQIQVKVDFLESDLRDRPKKHRSIRAIFQGSWDMLSPHEQQILAKVSIFSGSFDLKAAEKVADASLTDLRSLISKSLLRYDIKANRYFFHPLLAQLGREQLVNDLSLVTDTEKHFMTYFAENLHNHQSAWFTSQETEIYSRLAQDQENYIMAWRLIINHQNWTLLSKMLHGFDRLMVRQSQPEQMAIFAQEAVEALKTADAQTATDLQLNYLALSLLLVQASHIHSHQNVTELLNQAQALIDSFEGSGVDVQPEMGKLKRIRGENDQILDPENALSHLLAALEIFRDLEHNVEIETVLGRLCFTYWANGEYEKAKSYGLESLAEASKRGDLIAVAKAHNHIALAFDSAGEYPEALEHYQKSLSIYRDQEHEYGLLAPLLNLSEMCQSMGEYKLALKYGEEFADLVIRLGVKADYAFIGVRDQALLHMGVYDQSLARLESLLEYTSGPNYAQQHGYVLMYLGQFALAHKDFAEAGTYFDKAKSAFDSIQYVATQNKIKIFQGYADFGLGNMRQALSNLLDVYKNSPAEIDYLYALPLVSLLLARINRFEDGFSLYQHGDKWAQINRSKWFYDIAGKQIQAEAESRTAREGYLNDRFLTTRIKEPLDVLLANQLEILDMLLTDKSRSP